MIDMAAARASLPKTGERIIAPDLAEGLTVAWCSGWTWPPREPVPTVLYAQPYDAAGHIYPVELRVVPAHDDAGRYWIADRRGL